MPTAPPTDTENVGELLRWWFANVAPGLAWSTSTEKIYAGIHRNHLEPALGTLSLKQLTPEAIAHFLDNLEGHRVRQLARRLLALALSFAPSGREE